MPLLKGKELLKHAIENEYAIPAFGFVNLEGALAAVRAAEELNAPIILQTTQGGISYAGHEELAAIGKAVAEKATVPVALHLDHGRDLEYHENSIKLGYTSLMIDGSTLPFEENVEITNKVSAMQKDEGISIEAELGTIGGKEDDMEEEENFTKVEEAVEFVEKTNIDMLAVACGTAHGFFTETPHINQELLKEIHEKTNKMPLVLHGGTGVPLEQITEAIGNGIRKANFDSELKQGIIDGVMEYMKENPKAYDLRKINEVGINKAKEIAKAKIVAVKADNKNWL